MPSTLLRSSSRERRLWPGNLGAGLFTQEDSGIRCPQSPGPQLLCVASHSLWSLPGRGGAAFIWPCMSPQGQAGPLAGASAFCTHSSRTTTTTGLRRWLREQKGSIDSAPLVIHHLSQRFPECSPLTTGDFGRTSKVR